MNTEPAFICTSIKDNPRALAGILLCDQRPQSISEEELACLLKKLLTEHFNTEDARPLTSCENKPEKAEAAPSLSDISRVLYELGMPANLLGYQYLRSAITIAASDVESLRGITKILYPRVAEEFNTTPSRVERAIRHAIEVVWDRGDIDTLQCYFGNSIDSNRGKPTNSEFIAKIADVLLLGMKAAPRSAKLW